MLENITFANPKLLWGLLIIPAVIVWYIFRQKKQDASVRFSDMNGFESLPKSWRVYGRHLLFVLQMAALALLIVAIARPQSTSTSETSNIEGIDIILAQDVSGSMLARDLNPTVWKPQRRWPPISLKDAPPTVWALWCSQGSRSHRCL